MQKSLDLEEILKTCMSGHWQKVAMVIARLSEKIGRNDLSDEFVSNAVEVITKLISDGVIESNGDIANIRHSEVRVLDANNTHKNA